MSNHNGNNKINKSNNVQMKTNHKFGNPVQHVGHVLILLGFVSTFGGPREEIRQISGPCYCSLELLYSGPGVRLESSPY